MRLFLSSIKQEKFAIEAFIYGDTLPKPQQANLIAEFTVDNKLALNY